MISQKFYTFILDIECVGDKNLVDIYSSRIKAPKNYKDQAKIDEYLKAAKENINGEMAVDTDYSKINLIGLKNYDDGTTVFFENVKDFATFLDMHKDDYLRLVTFNGKKFDLPIIIKNGLKERLNLPYKELRDATKRFQRANDGNLTHVDIMEVISDYNDFKSLAEYSSIYLNKTKETDTEDFFKNATIEDLKKRCAEDLELTAELYGLFIPIC